MPRSHQRRHGWAGIVEVRMGDRTVWVDGIPESLDFGLNLMLLGDKRLLLHVLHGRFELLHALKDGSRDRVSLHILLWGRRCLSREHARVDVSMLKELLDKVKGLGAGELPRTKDSGQAPVCTAELLGQDLTIRCECLGESGGLTMLLGVLVDGFPYFGREARPVLFGRSEPVGGR